MRKRILTTLLLAMPLCSIADTVSIRADYWYPMNGDPNSATPGFMIEIAQKALAKAGHTVDYAIMPWERALDSVRKGTFDCVVGAYKSDAPDFVFPTNSQGIDSNVVYVKKGNTWRYTDLNSLKQVKLGGIQGYSYGDEIDAFIEQNPDNIKLAYGPTALEQNIKKLAAGRLDGVLESPSVFEAKLKEMNLQGQFEPAGTITEAEGLYIACSPAKSGSPSIVKLIDDGTQALRESGELATILNKYGLKDWK